MTESEQLLHSSVHSCDVDFSPGRMNKLRLDLIEVFLDKLSERRARRDGLQLRTGDLIQHPSFSFNVR